MSYAHSKAVIHRDLKPENIYVGDFGQVKVIDWGLGKVISHRDFDTSTDEFDANLLNNMTLAGRIKGTPAYMAPEQCSSSSDCDERSDVYSLGAILYSCLTLQAPVKGHTSEEVMQKTLRGEIIPPTKVGKDDIDPRLEKIILKAMSLEPGDRYQSVIKLQEDLLKYRGGFATEVEQAGFFTQLILLIKRHRQESLIFLGFSLVFFFFGSYSIQEIRKSNQQALIALDEAEQSRDEALRAEDLAEKNKLEAQEALILYKEENREKQKLSAEMKELLKGLVDSKDYKNID
jgi:serine/threonine protein kinase